jgi:hypothetical protein
MPLDPTQSQAIESWFKQKCPQHACPACGGQNWETLDAVKLDAVRLSPSLNPLSHPSLSPHVSVIRVCQDCAYLAHFLLSGMVHAASQVTP